METPLIKFDSPQGHYVADCCVVWCFDDRFSGLLAEFQKKFTHTDLIRIAGGAKALAGGLSPERDFVSGQIAASLKLHATKALSLMVHMDCGGYGGSKAFDNDHQKEWDHHAAELKKAADFARATFPEIIDIECWIADFDGLHGV